MHGGRRRRRCWTCCAPRCMLRLRCTAWMVCRACGKNSLVRKLAGDQHGVNCTVPSAPAHLAQLEAERAQRAAEERKQRQEAMRRDMIAANQLQLQLKARGWAVGWWLWWSK